MLQAIAHAADIQTVMRRAADGHSVWPISLLGKALCRCGYPGPSFRNALAGILTRIEVEIVIVLIWPQASWCCPSDGWLSELSPGLGGAGGWRRIGSASTKRLVHSADGIHTPNGQKLCRSYNGDTHHPARRPHPSDRAATATLAATMSQSIPAWIGPVEFGTLGRMVTVRCPSRPGARGAGCGRCVGIGSESLACRSARCRPAGAGAEAENGSSVQERWAGCWIRPDLVANSRMRRTISRLAA